MSFPSLGEVGARAGASLQSLATAASAAAEAQVAGLGAQLTSRLQAALKLGQSTRLLQIETALPSASLVVERCRVTEAVHATEPLWAEVDCVSTHALLELKALNGEQVTLRLMLADGSWRAWHGYVVQAAQLGADGGLARYRLTLVPNRGTDSVIGNGGIVHEATISVPNSSLPPVSSSFLMICTRCPAVSRRQSASLASG